MTGYGTLIPQLIILCIGVLCAMVAIYRYPSPQSWTILMLIFAATTIAIIASLAVELLS